MVILNAQAAAVILKEGTIVSTKLGSSVAWYRNIICKSNENSLWVELIVPYLENIISPGMPINIKYCNEYFLYLFEGTVTGISTGNPSFVEISVTTAEELVNTRSFPRYDTYLVCTAQTIWDEEGCFSILTNISYGGMAFMCSQRFDCGEELGIRIYLPENQQVYVRGKIINRCVLQGTYDYSLQFIIIDNEDRIKLSRHFSVLENEISTIQERFHKALKFITTI